MQVNYPQYLNGVHWLVFAILWNGSFSDVVFVTRLASSRRIQTERCFLLLRVLGQKLGCVSRLETLRRVGEHPSYTQVASSSLLQ